MTSKLLVKCSVPDAAGGIQRTAPESAGGKYIGFEAYRLKAGAGLIRDMVPEGRHPVCPVAGYDNYYLNVMAGPVKLWRFTWERNRAWINSDAYPRRKS
jgi:5-deoxy-D-glucuronate isomerase